MNSFRQLFRVPLLLAVIAILSFGQPVATPLWSRGYSVIPTPASVNLSDGDIVLDDSWSYRASGLAANHIAVRWLIDDLRSFHSIELKEGRSKIIQLAVEKDAVRTPSDPAIRSQAYRLKIAPNSIEITGNSDAGLFYGVQTLLQLVKQGSGNTRSLPATVIEDWPKLQLRFLHWDTKNHQDRIATLKRYLDWSARMKINMIGFELEDKFEYPSNPSIGAPGAFTSAELQEIVNYGLERFIQVVPIIQAPAHLKYVLKHPEFAKLRADGNNYQAKLCNEESYKLIFQMYDDVIRATRGVDYIYVSTDEVYYAGIEGTCGAYNPEFRSKKWMEFAQRAHDHVAKQGRRMLAWLEYPLLPEQLKSIPADVIDGVMSEAAYLPIEKEKGMRQLIYTSFQGSEFLFPDYFTVAAELRDPPVPGADDPLEFERGSTGRVKEAFEQISSNRVWKANPIGVFGAAWDDSGLHNETFWLGWSVAAQYGWNSGTASPQQHTAEFMKFYYGSRADGMTEIYRSLQVQTRAWQRTWDRVVSRVRGPGYGNSDGKGIGTTRYDQTLSMPPLPAQSTLEIQPQFVNKYRKFLAEAQQQTLENDRLLQAIQEQIGKVERNQYNLEVLSALASFAGHHWNLLLTLADAERSMEQARLASQKKRHDEAMKHLTSAYNAVAAVEKEGEQRFQQLIAVFEKSQFPKGRSVGGKTFFQVLDDTKDHWAARTADWGFMFAPEKSIGIAQWLKGLRNVIQDYAKSNRVPVGQLTESPAE